jgi:hypothetical protein
LADTKLVKVTIDGRGQEANTRVLAERAVRTRREVVGRRLHLDFTGTSRRVPRNRTTLPKPNPPRSVSNFSRCGPSPTTTLVPGNSRLTKASMFFSTATRPTLRNTGRGSTTAGVQPGRNTAVSTPRVQATSRSKPHAANSRRTVSVATMTLGNVAALTQTNMKRLLAYSSIAHAGYIMMGVVALSQKGARGTMVYLLAYLFMNLGAFLVVMLIHRHEGSFDLRDYPGLYRRAPFLTLAMAIFLLSLMGIPPLVGFMGKLYVFAAIIERGPSYWWYALVAAVNAAVAAFYYARVLKTMIIEEPEVERPTLALPASDLAWLLLLVAANVVPLFFWSAVESWTQASLTLYARL